MNGNVNTVLVKLSLKRKSRRGSLKFMIDFWVCIRNKKNLLRIDCNFLVHREGDQDSINPFDGKDDHEYWSPPGYITRSYCN